MSTTITFRIDEELKSQLQELMSELGMDVTTYFIVAAKQAVREQAIPFKICANEKKQENKVVSNNLPQINDSNMNEISKEDMDDLFKEIDIMCEEIDMMCGVENETSVPSGILSKDIVNTTKEQEAPNKLIQPNNENINQTSNKEMDDYFENDFEEIDIE